MILRVPDYYEEFRCIADKCKDSCCIGWEINIDEDTHDYYSNTEGSIGKRLRENMYVSADGEYSFRLKGHGRCPFLNEKNLCDICIEMGEESLSEVCTEYPRFTLDYGNVFQKCLSLSCEEVGRIVFTRETPVRLVERELPDMGWTYDEVNAEAENVEMNADEESNDDKAAETAWYAFLEEVQKRMLEILQDHSKSIWLREQEYLNYAEQAQQIIAKHGDNDIFTLDELTTKINMQASNDKQNVGNNADQEDLLQSIDSYETFDERFHLFEQMEELGREWGTAKKQVRERLTEDSYRDKMTEFLLSRDYLDNDYEQLLVYFTFRYFLQTIYDYNLLAKAKMAVTFTRVIRDLDVVRYVRNGGRYTREDRIDTARIFSKEVEHSEENVEFVQEELEFKKTLW